MAKPKFLSLGGGVQSTTLYLMAALGQIERPEAAIFADTHWEPEAVYRNVDDLRRAHGDALPIVTVSAGDIRRDTLDNAEGAAKRTASLPFHLDSGGGKAGMLRRQCSYEYKIAPIRKWIDRRECELWIGISVDEAHRMKPADVRYITHRWPLVELGMTRHDCQRWLQAHGWAAPKSACIGCPYHSNAEWRDIRGNNREWREATEFDAAIRRLPRVDSPVYLHKSLLPLPMVDLRTATDKGQRELDLWGNECEGVCNV